MGKLKQQRTKLASFLQKHIWRKYLLIGLLLIVFPVVLVTAVEWIQRSSIADLWTWMIQSKGLAVANGLICFFVELLLYCLTGSLFFSFSLSFLLFSVMSMISLYKSKLIGEPFFPWDVFIKKEGLDILPLISNGTIFIQTGIILLVTVLIALLRLVMPRLSIPVSLRVVLGLLSLFMLYSFAYKPELTGGVFGKLGASEIAWDQEQNYSSNGTVLAFTSNIQHTVVEEPPGYSESRMAELARLLNQAKPVSAPAGGIKPNVILVMNEAFWDPTLLPDVKFSEDPVPTLHQLQQTATSGYLLSPQFGGGTCNVEFEVLTGNSMSFLPGGSIPYQQFINRPTPSLASFFEDNGYKSTGIHSYEGWFWNRNEVYKQMGFESFMSAENFNNPQYNGLFIGDSEVSKAIIRQTEASERPVFIYAVTMQNHGPYDSKRYDSNPITVSGKLDDQAKMTLENYTHGVHDADQSLKQLIDYYSQSGEPTMVVFFGDHLPMLGYDYEVYKQGGFIHASGEREWTLDEWKKMHSVPFVVWTNYPMPKQNFPILSDSFLGANLLQMLHMDMPGGFQFGYNLSRKVPGLLGNLVVRADQTMSRQPAADLTADLENYRLMQYDRMFGKNYVETILNGGPQTNYPLPNYNDEFSKMYIDASDLAEIQAGRDFHVTDGKSVLRLHGSNLFTGSVVYLNGTKVSPIFITEDTVEVPVPKDLYQKPGVLEIQLKLLNTKNLPVAESNMFTIPVK
jgi:phosphoglycerol transferase MdoB-like AlkP superfamily enzyme